jgi:hypothetical protein
MLSFVIRLFVIVICANATVQQMSPASNNIEIFRPYPKQPGHRRAVPELFHHRYSEQTFIGTHNSVAIRTKENNWSLSGNQ